MEIVRTEMEIDEEISSSYTKDFSDMTYAEGVREALSWVLGQTHTSPMED